MYHCYCTFVVRLTGLEPARREALEPKSNVSASFTTGANIKPDNCGLHREVSSAKWNDYLRRFLFSISSLISATVIPDSLTAVYRYV